MAVDTLEEPSTDSRPPTRLRRFRSGVLALVILVVAGGGLAAWSHDRDRTLPAAADAGMGKPVATWTFESGSSGEMTLGAPPAGKLYFLVAGCVGSGSLTLSETDPTGELTPTVTCAGKYSTFATFPGIHFHDGTIDPAGPGPYSIAVKVHGDVTEASVFVTLATQ